ncbi:fimbria/pilus periplasmic chaperone [Enterobacter bugandensis]
MKWNVANIAALFSLAAVFSSSAVNVAPTVTNYSVWLGSSRIIYSPSSGGTMVTVNNPNDYPVLVQSKVFTEDTASVGPFITTPPLFRLDAKQQSRLRVIMTNNNYAKDRETLFWFCATGIPPEKGDAWVNKQDLLNENSAALNVRIKLRRCIKLIVRPDSLKGKPEDKISALIGYHEKNKLWISNPTPFYINLKSLSANNKAIADPGYIAPFGTASWPISGTARINNISGSLINDLGGESQQFSIKLR